MEASSEGEAVNSISSVLTIESLPDFLECVGFSLSDFFCDFESLSVQDKQEMHCPIFPLEFSKIRRSSRVNCQFTLSILLEPVRIDSFNLTIFFDLSFSI